MTVEDGRRLVSKIKGSNQGSPLLKQGKSSKPRIGVSPSTNLGRVVADLDVMNVQVSTKNQVSVPRKGQSRRKIDLQRALAVKESKPNESTGDDRPDSCSIRFNNRLLDFKVIYFLLLSVQ